MFTSEVSVGNQLSTPVLLSNEAPLGRTLDSHKYVELLSGSVIVTMAVELIPTVILNGVSLIVIAGRMLPV